MCAAYAGLPERLKRAVEGRRAIFSYVKRLAGYQGVDRVISEDARRKTPPIVHPLVHTHPVTGRKALYLDSTTTVGIDAMDEASGSARCSHRRPRPATSPCWWSCCRCPAAIASHPSS